MVAWCLVMDDESGDESAVEISHSDIDSILTTHLGSNFCYKRREANESVTHILKKMKGNDWVDHLTIEDDDVKGFDNEDIATFIIHKVMWNRRSHRTTGIILLLMFIIGVPVMFYIDHSLGITDPYSLPGVLTGIAVMFPFFLLCGIWSNYDEKSVDNQLYSTRSNFITVLRKMKELEENEVKKAIIEGRIQRLLERFQVQPIE